MTAKQPRSQRNPRQLKASALIALMVTSAVLTACTSNKNRNFDFPEPPIRRGSF